MQHQIKGISIVAMVVMTVLSFANLFSINIAGAAVIVGVVFFFVVKAREKQGPKESGFDIKTVGVGLKCKQIWFWLLLPIIMDAVSAGLSRLVLPQYVAYELTRAGAYVSFDKIALLLFQLAFLALGEEIAWRAFFQNQLTRVLPITPVLLISSLLFALGHWTVLSIGNTAVVVYSVFFVFVNSVLYGVIFHKSKNAWISGIAHFAANLLSVIFLPFFA